MKKIKVLILTYDQQIGLAELVVKKYSSLGLAANLEFLIPVNSQNTKFNGQYDSVRFIPSKPDILSTMKALLDECDDDEWVYWGIDDRYPIEVERDSFNSIVTAVRNGLSRQVEGIKLLPWREELRDSSFEISGNEFFLQKPISMFGFWHHQFLRSKILKQAFFKYNKHSFNSVNSFNSYYQKMEKIPFFDNIYVSSRPIISLGEPLWCGKLTTNGVLELQGNNCSIPDYEKVDKVIGFLDVESQMKSSKGSPKLVSLDDVGLI